MSSSDSNGGNGAREIHLLDRLVITYDRTTDQLQVDGKCNSLDLMLDMLGRATRSIEAQLRSQQAFRMQQELAQMARDQAVADSVRRGR